MIDKTNLENVLIELGFKQGKQKIWTLHFPVFDCDVVVDFDKEAITYPVDKGFKVNDETTSNFSHPENFVVLECVCRLLKKGYRPEHIELEKRWNLGHDSKGGKADICVCGLDGKMLFIVECKTWGSEYNKERKNILVDGGQLFSYWQQELSTQWLVLYASTWNDGDRTIQHSVECINCSDDPNIIKATKKNKDLLTYEKANGVKELFEVWDETYEKNLFPDVIFNDDTKAYEIGVRPLRKKDLIDFSEGDKIVNKFEEILRHNNVSDKENAFNRLVAMFIAKLADEITKEENDEIEFQYKAGTDTYESLQDRLQRLYRDGMDRFMKEEIVYIADTYPEELVKQFTGQKREKMIKSLKETIRQLKFYTNNDFAFIDVHNEQLFEQNAKVLVEMVQLFEKYRIIGSNDLQKLGDLFEQLLNKGFKQNEGQFFTAMPITRFIWDALPLEHIVRPKGKGFKYPKVIDFACGAGHFLTQGYEAIIACYKELNKNVKTLPAATWTRDAIFGIEKDYRLARVSKISMFMHGAGDSNIVFGDGLENYAEKGIQAGGFDVLVANPPYSVKAFKVHLKLKNNTLTVLDKVSNDGGEIETAFVERMAQLLKPNGIAAVILPSSILNKDGESFKAAREQILQNFKIAGIVALGSKTFGATGTNTVILFLQKFNEPPKMLSLLQDSIAAIFDKDTDDEQFAECSDLEIFDAYCQCIGVDKQSYDAFAVGSREYTEWEGHNYFGMYCKDFLTSTDYKKKGESKSFKELNVDKQKAELNDLFYKKYLPVEQEKMLYFALTYKQSTVIITAPADNNGQKEFLGYDWSNRKGQEGIQIITKGGKLYNDKDRYDNTTLAAAIRNNYVGESIEFTDSNKQYANVVSTKDMLDFTKVEFDKTLKTTVRKLVMKSGHALHRLTEEIFNISIGSRVVSDEIVEDGRYPVFSANVKEEFGRINKLLIEDFSVPSILWGIDGDWMVNYVPAGVEFYPTDHCGVLRVNSDDILPQYLAYCLEAEGNAERFSRTNRASTERVKNLTVQVPSLEEQQKIVAEFATLDSKIKDEDDAVKAADLSIANKFEKMFKKKKFEVVALGDIVSVFGGLWKGKSNDLQKVKVIRNTNFTMNGKIDFGDVAEIDVDSKQLTQRKLESGDIIIEKSGGSETQAVGRVVLFDLNTDDVYSYSNFTNRIRLVNKAEFNAVYLHRVLLDFYLEGKTFDYQSGMSGLKNLDLNKYLTIAVAKPPIDLQNQFADFVKEQEGKKKTAQEHKEKLLAQRQELVQKYFG